MRKLLNLVNEIFRKKDLYIQLLFILSGLLIPFFFPIFLGLETYGTFVKATSLVFLFQRIVDISSEPIISNSQESVSIRFAKLFTHFTLYFLVFLILLFLMKMYNQILITISLIVTSFGVNSLFLLNNKKSIIIYLVWFNAVLVLLLLLGEYLKIVDPTLIIVFTNFSATLLIGYYLFYYIKSGLIKIGKFQLKDLLSSTLMFNRILYAFLNISLGFALPFVMSTQIGSKDLGSIKFSLSIFFASVYFFPINPKRLIFALTPQSEVGEKNEYFSVFKYLKLHNYFTIFLSIVYVILNIFRVKFYDNFIITSVIISFLSFPLFFLEKFLIANSKINYLKIFNLFSGLIILVLSYFFVKSLDHFFIMITGFLIIAFLTHAIFIEQVKKKWVLPYVLGLFLILVNLIYAL
jgi:hypothetical protein